MATIKNKNILNVAKYRIETVCSNGYFLNSHPMGWMYYQEGKTLYELFPNKESRNFVFDDVEDILYVANRYKEDFVLCQNGEDLINAFERLRLKMKAIRAFDVDFLLKKYSELL